MMCPHGAPATIAPLQPRVVVSGQPVAPFASIITVTGCPFQIPFGVGTKPQPCLLAKWVAPAARVMVSGQPAALVPGPAICQSPDQIPQGPPIVSTFQTRVIGT
jgi:hypothetical protein